MKKRLLFYSLLIVGLLTSCAEEERHPLPYVRVDVSIPIDWYPDLMGGLPVKVLQHCGYNNNRIIIVPQGAGDKYEAFDATCTRDITTDIASINVNTGTFTATCPKCSTVYNLHTGYAQNQSFRLQRYRAYRSGNRIIITN